MGKLLINRNLVTPEKAEALMQLCPFGAISYENGRLDISSGCKMCKMCVRKGGGLVTFEEEVKTIDKSLWKGICIYADCTGVSGICPARSVQVVDTTGAGDAFCAGVSIGLTYGKSLPEAIDIGSTLAASVIISSENVCPRFLPGELGLDIDIAE